MVGFGQILVVLLVLVLLFGNLPKLLKDLALGIKTFKKTLDEKETQKQLETKDSSEKSQDSNSVEKKS
jgi:TatA/E family protein of Tat protein translocase